jgi:sulfonate transport system ATP-binding protein
MTYVGLADRPRAWFGATLEKEASYSDATGLPIHFESVSKRFGEREVLRCLELEIPAGQFVAIIGRSGCGKTTLLRLVAGLDRISSGSLNVGKSVVTGLQKRVRILFQDARLLQWQNVLNNVGLARGDNWRERAVGALRDVNLMDRADDWPSVLSGGQKQRVALARALVSEPNILLLDEPFGALDALTRSEMHQLLIRIWQKKHFTSVLITHDVGEAVALADRVIVLRDGAVSLDIPIDLPRSNRSLGSAVAGRLQATILQHV